MFCQTMNYVMFCQKLWILHVYIYIFIDIYTYIHRGRISKARERAHSNNKIRINH